jgi:hypothetical protein
MVDSPIGGMRRFDHSATMVGLKTTVRPIVRPVIQVPLVGAETEMTEEGRDGT